LNGYIITDGIYYQLIELPALYHNSMFIEIIETQQDETEFNRNYIKEKIC